MRRQMSTAFSLLGCELCSPLDRWPSVQDPDLSPASGMGPPGGEFRQWDGTSSSPVMGPPVRQ